MKNGVYPIETDSQKKAGGEGSDKNISVGKNGADWEDIEIGEYGHQEEKEAEEKDPCLLQGPEAQAKE